MADGDKNTKVSHAKRGAIVFFTVVAALVCVLVLLILRLTGCMGGGAAPSPTPSPSPTPAPSATATPAPTAFTPRTATIRAVGDLMMHAEQLEAAHLGGEAYDFSRQYAMIADSLSAADYTIANLETTVGLYSDKPYSGYPLFNAPPELLDAICEAGIDFVSLANNHILDRYYDGMVITVGNVAYSGLDYGGVNLSQEQKDTANIVEVNGIKLGMLCYTQMTNGMEVYCDERATQFGVNYVNNCDFATDVQRAREAGADVVIAFMHWGKEYVRSSNGAQQRLTNRLIEVGVDVIIGSHPHVVQPAGMREGALEDGTPREVLLAYSLGNFNSAMTVEYTDSGIILEFTIVEREDGGFDIVDIGFVPTYCWNRNGSFETVRALDYYDQRPEGMTAEQHQRLRKSVDDVQALMGGRLEMLSR